MVYVVRKLGEGSYKVENKYTRVTKAEGSSHSEVQRVADSLNRGHERTRPQRVFVS